MTEPKYPKSLLVTMHKYSSNHMSFIQDASHCICFYCMKRFDKSTISEVIDNHQTALCPHCGIDSVLADVKYFGVDINEDFIQAMHDHWFGDESGRTVRFYKGKKVMQALILEDEKDLDINSVMFDAHQTAVEKGFWDDEKPNIGEKLMLVCTEVAEAMEEVRNGVKLNEVVINQGKPEGFGVELADIIIRVLDLAGHADLDMASLIRLKMQYNSTRPKKNGKQC